MIPSSPSPRRALALVFTIMLLDVIGLTILFPVGAFLVRRYSGEAFMVTLLSALYAAGQFCAAPLLGRLADRFGRRPILLASVVGSAAGYLLFGVGGALWVLFLSRVVDGLTGGNMSTAAAYIADVSRPEERARNFSLIGLAWGMGLVLGPALGAAAGQIRLELPAFVAAALSLASAGLCLRFLPESLPPERRDRRPLRASDLNPVAAVARALMRPGLAIPLVALALFNLAFTGASGTEAPFLIERFAARPWQLGLLLVGVGICVGVVQGLGVPRFVSRHGERRVAAAALVVQALASLVTSLAPSLAAACTAVLLRSAASGFVFPTLSALVSTQAGEREQGELLGVTTALASVMSVLGPLGAGVAYDHLLPAAPYWLSAGLLLGAAALAGRVPGRRSLQARVGGEAEGA